MVDETDINERADVGRVRHILAKKGSGGPWAGGYVVSLIHELDRTKAALREAVDCAVGYMNDRHVDGEASEDVIRWRRLLEDV